MQQPNGSFYQPPGYPGYPYPQQAPQPPTPDAKTLEVFKKNWEYYSRNPIELENLAKSNPAKHANLFRYVCLLHFVAFFHVASLFSTGVDNEKVGVDNEKALELTNSTVFHRGRQ